MTNPSFEFNNTLSGGGNTQINQGQNVSASQENGPGSPATVDEVFSAIDQAVEELPEADREEFKLEVVEPLKLMANLPIAEQQEPTTLEKAKALAERLSPFAPKINKFLGAVTRSGLELLAASNPIAGVLLAGVKAIG